MTVAVGQVYRDNDPRLEGRTLKVTAVGLRKATLEVRTNANDIQALLDDPTPGTRSYLPKDKRGKTTQISLQRLESKAFSLLAPEPDVTGPAL